MIHSGVDAVNDLDTWPKLLHALEGCAKLQKFKLCHDPIQLSDAALQRSVESNCIGSAAMVMLALNPNAFQVARVVVEDGHSRHVRA